MTLQLSGFTESIANNISDLVFILNENKDVVFINQAVEKFLSCKAEGLLNNSIESIVHDVEKRAINEFIEFSKISKDSREISLCSGRGGYVPVLMSCKQIHGDDSSFYILSGYDLEEEYSRTETIQAQKQQLETLTQNLPGLVFQLVKSADGYLQFIFLGGGAQKILRVRSKDLLEDASLFFNRIDEKDKEEFDKKFDKSYETFGPLKGVFRFEKSCESSKCWIAINAQPIRLPNSDVMWNGIISDVTERLYAEKQRDRLLESPSSLNAVLTQSGEFIYINPSFQELLIEEKGSLIGTSITRYFSSCEKKKFMAEVSSVKDKYKQVSLQQTFQTKRNGKQILDCEYGIDRDVNNIFLYAHNQTEIIKVKEHLEEVNQSLAKAEDDMGRFVDFITTEISEVLNQIKTTSGDFDHSHYSNKNGLIPMINSLDALIEEIKEFSYIQKKDNSFSVRETKIISLKKEVLKLNNKYTGNTDVEFKVHFASNFPEQIYIHKKSFVQIVHQLVSNAFKYTKKGFVELSIQNNNNEDMFITVKDTGIGIKKDNIEGIWNSLKAEDPKARKKIKGFGLGLAIVERLVSQMNGNVAVESKYRQGTTFTVTIPITKRSKKAR